MHLIAITSVVDPVAAPNIFSPGERFDQLLKSIQSVVSKIPDPIIVVIEGSAYTHEQRRAVLHAGAHHIFHTNTHNKHVGEALSLHAFFTSSVFGQLFDKYHFQTINKLSGRYFLLDNFVFSHDGETCICKVDHADTSYSGHGFLYTRFYSIPVKYVDQYVAGLARCCQEILINLEHSFYLHDVIPRDKINPRINKINVGGLIAPTGEYVED